MAGYVPSAYDAKYFGGKAEEDIMNRFWIQFHDARSYFLASLKPRFDRAYKLYIAYNGDRQKEIQSWQSNVFVPYTMSIIETMMPRILDARPEFTVEGRNESSQAKAPKQQKLLDFFWEKAQMDRVSEELTRSALVYGTGFLQAGWKKDERKLRFLKSKDIRTKKPEWTEETKVFYDAPHAESVDPYSLWYDWHNTAAESKQYWFKRLLLTEPEIRRRYPAADKTRLDLALKGQGMDLNDYATVRLYTKTSQESIVKNATQYSPGVRGYGGDKYQVIPDIRLRFHEVLEWWRPWDDAYSVIVNYVPVFDKAEMPIPFDFKEAPFIDLPFLRAPFEFEGYGLPLLMENPQIMLNLIKNQRLDEAILRVHKMWIVNPLANVNKEELVTRPFGIIYTPDPNGVRPVEFSDINQSAYREEELLKGDMRYSSGIDDISMGVGGGGGSATEVRHLREATLERVRLFVNHMGETYSKLARYWMSMQRQFFTEEMTIRVIGDDGQPVFPLIEHDDLVGEFDYRATVLPAIAGQNDIEKKQNMDLFQLLVQMPFVDQRKLVKKVLEPWNFPFESITNDQGAVPPGMEAAGPEAMGPEAMGLPPAPELPPLPMTAPTLTKAMMQALSAGNPNAIPSINPGPISLEPGSIPPTAQDATKKASGPASRGFNRGPGARVNTDIPLGANANPESALQNRALSIQNSKR